MEITLNLSKKQMREMLQDMSMQDVVKLLGDNEMVVEALGELMKPDAFIRAVLPYINPEDMVKAMLEDEPDSVIDAVLTHGREELNEALEEVEA